MKNFVRLLLLCCITFSGSHLFAQGPTDKSGDPGGIDAKGKIIGKVIDQMTESPLEFATISVLSPVDSSIVTGEITDLDGNFQIEVKYGEYLVKVEFIGYQANFKKVTVSKAQPEVNIGAIALNTDAQVLAEVEVRAEKSQLQMGLDKKVFNVGKDLANTSGTASEILDNIPSVTVDVEGNVSLRGSQGVRILVDGKPSGLVGVRGSDGLRSLPSNLIERVEVITNPSARYEAEGMTGIINIVLKKDRRKGINGSVDLTTGWPHRHGAAVNLNFRRKNINFFTNYGFRWDRAPGFFDRYQEFYNDETTNFVDQDATRQRGGWSNNIRAGADYFFNDNNILTGSLLYRISHDDNISTITYRDYVDVFPDNLTRITVREQDEVEEEPNLEYALNYKRTFEKKDQELTASFQYRESTESEAATFKETEFDPSFTPTGGELDQRSNNDEGERSALIRVDYTHPFGKEGKFEVGYFGSLRQIDNKYLVEEFFDNEWQRLAELSNDFNYDENIHAGYAIIGNKFNRFSFQAGLRFEHSEILTELLETQEENDRTYANLFPSVFLGYEFNEGNSLQVSFSKRISRPRFWDLNPFFTFADARNIFRGNPNVDPEFTDSYEVSYIKYFDKASISSSVYYRHTTGVIQRIQTLVEQEGNLITVRQPENLATEDSYGLEFILSYDPTDWWRMNGNFNFFRSITDGTNFGEGFQAKATTMTGRFNSRVTFWENVDLQLSFSYRAPRNTTQGRRKSTYSFDFGLSKDIMKKKATLTLSGRDMFNTRIRRSVTFGDNFYSTDRFQWRARQLTLTFNYRLNQQKRRGGGRSGGGDYDGGGEF